MAGRQTERDPSRSWMVLQLRRVLNPVDELTVRHGDANVVAPG